MTQLRMCLPSYCAEPDRWVRDGGLEGAAARAATAAQPACQPQRTAHNHTHQPRLAIRSECYANRSFLVEEEYALTLTWLREPCLIAVALPRR
jgi:hypothetical protein